MIELESIFFQILQPHKHLLNQMSKEDIENLSLGINEFIMKRDEEVYDFSKHDLLFGEVFAYNLNELQIHEGTEWLDVDFFDFSSCVGAGINMTLKQMIEGQGFQIFECNGNDVITWDSGISLDE